MDTDYRNGSDGQDNAESYGGSTQRMDMSDMSDDAVGESSADAVSAAAAGTDATVNQGSGTQDYSAASNVTGAETQASGSDSAAPSDSSSVHKAPANESVSNAGGSKSRSGRIPDYALEMIAEQLHRKGHQISADDLDSALGESGFTITPDPWQGYSPRPTPAAGAVQQREAQQQGGFVSAAPVASGGAFIIPEKSEATTPAAPLMDEALSQLQADEAQTVSSSGSAETMAAPAHPAPSSGLEVAHSATSDTAAGPASGMSDASTTEQPAPLSDITLPAAAVEEGIAAGEEALHDAIAPWSSPQSSGQEADVETAPASATENAAPSAAPELTYGTNLPLDGETYPAQSGSEASATPGGSEDQLATTTQPTGTNEFPPVASGETTQPVQAGGQSQPSSAEGDYGQPAMQGMGPLMQGGVAPQQNPPQMQPVANTVTVGTQVGQQLAPHITISNGVEFPFGDKSEILIGREDPVSDIFPDIDMTNFGGEEGGVSRRHARIIRDGDTYLLEDLNSTNYTKLNGVKLIPKIPQAMRDGDHLSFGKVEATFHLYK